jgi:hypothetical protein
LPGYGVCSCLQVVSLALISDIQTLTRRGLIEADLYSLV